MLPCVCYSVCVILNKAIKTCPSIHTHGITSESSFSIHETVMKPRQGTGKDFNKKIDRLSSPKLK